MLIEAVGYGLLIPAAVAFVVAHFGRRRLSEEVAERSPPAIGFVCGCALGYALLPGAEWVPARHWHWLPLVSAAAAVIGPVGLARGVRKPERWLLYALLMVAASVALVPTWSSLEPARSVQIPALAAELLLLACLLIALPDHVLSRRFVYWLSLSALAAAMLIAAGVSLTYGRLAGLAAAALLGVALASPKRIAPSAVRGLIPAYVLWVGGAGYVGGVEPQDPLYLLLIAPAAPLVLWAVCCGRPARMSGIRRTALEAALLTGVLLLVGAALHLRTGGGTDAW